MAREEFLRNVERAMIKIAPASRPDGLRADPAYLRSELLRHEGWMRPGAVAGLEPADFPDRPDLAAKVAAFRASVEAIRGSDSPNESDPREAADAFLAVLTAVAEHLEGFGAYALLRREPFPDYVRDFAVRVGPDSTGDASIWVWIIVSDDMAGRLLPEVEDLTRRVQAVLDRSDLRLWPYVSVRTESEQAELEHELAR